MFSCLALMSGCLWTWRTANMSLHKGNKQCIYTFVALLEKVSVYVLCVGLVSRCVFVYSTFIAEVAIWRWCSRLRVLSRSVK